LGDLERQTFSEIWNGSRAQYFRERLASGYLPIRRCLDCPERETTLRSLAKQRAADFSFPVLGIMIENIARCNLRCALCDRKTILKTRKRAAMTLGDLGQVAQVMKELGIQKISFFNLGEPFLSPDIFEELSLLRTIKPDLQIVSSTNGLLLDSAPRFEAALLLDYLYFSIDGPSQRVLSRYQKGGDYERVKLNLRSLLGYRREKGSSRPLIDWKYVLFRWNDRPTNLKAAIREAHDTGADFISFWPGYASLWDRSRRYSDDPFYRQLGHRFDRCRRIDLQNQRNP
jgi:pyruvate-formate lyase-activating enzyme